MKVSSYLIAALITTFSQATSALPQDNGMRAPYFSGKAIGLIGEKGNEIIPCRFSDVEYRGNGIFLMTGISENPYIAGQDKHLFNRNGEELTVKTPPASALKDVAWLGIDSDNDVAAPLDKLPADAVFSFVTEKGTGLCHQDGTVILPPTSKSVHNFGGGMAFIEMNVGQGQAKSSDTILNLTTGKQIHLKQVLQSNWIHSFSEGIAMYCHLDSHLSIIDMNGKCSELPQFRYARPFYKGFATVISNKRDTPAFFAVDKSFKRVSPETLNVENFNGDLAVATPRNDPRHRKGLVDRKFEYVVKPDFAHIRAIPDLCGSGSDRTIEYYERKTPPVYFANRYGSEEWIALSPEGKELFTFLHDEDNSPSKRGVKMPSRNGSIIRYLYRKTMLTYNTEVFFTIDGKEIPYGELPIAPGIYKKKADEPTERFSPINWAKKPYDRLVEFEHLLRDYDLIGLPERKISLLLPEREDLAETAGTSVKRSKYSLTPSLELKLIFKADKIIGWCLVKNGKDQTVIYKNVVVSKAFPNLGSEIEPSFETKQK